MSNPYISIIIPCYNAASTIGNTIDSVLRQNYDNYEIVIVDDGSTDDMSSVINNYKSDVIKYYKTENQGVSCARNFGIEKAKGDYIFFLDSDDELALDILCDMSNIPNFNDYDMIGALVARKVHENISLEKFVVNKCVFKKWDFLKLSLSDHPIGYYCVRFLYKRDFLLDLRFHKGIARGEDSLFLFECGLKKPNVYMLCKVGYIYIDNPDSVTHQIIPKTSADGVLKTLTIKRELLPEGKELLDLYRGHSAKVHMMLLKNYLLCDRSYNSYIRHSLKEFYHNKKYVLKSNLDFLWYRILKFHLYHLCRFVYRLRKGIK